MLSRSILNQCIWLLLELLSLCAVTSCHALSSMRGYSRLCCSRSQSLSSPKGLQPRLLLPWPLLQCKLLRCMLLRNICRFRDTTQTAQSCHAAAATLQSLQDPLRESLCRLHNGFDPACKDQTPRSAFEHPLEWHCLHSDAHRQGLWVG